MRRYETIFILRPELGESAQKDSIKRFEGLVGNNGGPPVLLRNQAGEGNHWLGVKL